MSHTPGPLTYTAPDGKQWEVVDVRLVNKGELYISPNGYVGPSEFSIGAFYPIVRPIVPEWITPTDEHAKQRPTVEVRDSEDSRWKPRTLVYVKPLGFTHPFQTVNDDHEFYNWKYCRMRNHEYKEPL